MKKVIYMRIGKPPFLLPEAVADTVTELAELTGNTTNGIYSLISHNKKKGIEKYYIKVEVDDDDE